MIKRKYSQFVDEAVDPETGESNPNFIYDEPLPCKLHMYSSNKKGKLSVLSEMLSEKTRSNPLPTGRRTCDRSDRS